MINQFFLIWWNITILSYKCIKDVIVGIHEDPCSHPHIPNRKWFFQSKKLSSAQHQFSLTTTANPISKFCGVESYTRHTWTYKSMLKQLIFCDNYEYDIHNWFTQPNPKVNLFVTILQFFFSTHWLARKGGWISDYKCRGDVQSEVLKRGRKTNCI